MNILFVAKNSPSDYSGGRFHAWLMAGALSFGGHRVVYLTNHRPIFAASDDDDVGSAGVEFVASRLLVAPLPRIRFDVVVIVPHLRSSRVLSHDWNFYRRGLARARRDGAVVVLLSFETPNWIEALLSSAPPRLTYEYWGRTAEAADVILSSTKEGTEYAREYYSPLNQDLRFMHCYPSINSRASDAVPEQRREQRIVVITRFSDRHKNAGMLTAVIDEALKGTTVEIIQGVGAISQPEAESLRARCASSGVNLEIRQVISEREKFTDLKRAVLLVFPSLFEGFGMPPVEAQYCGTRVVAFDLPVLREVNGRAGQVTFVPWGDYVAMKRAIVELTLQPYDHERVRQAISDIAKFENYAKRIDSVVTDVFRDLGPRAGRRDWR